MLFSSVKILILYWSENIFKHFFLVLCLKSLSLSPITVTFDRHHAVGSVGYLGRCSGGLGGAVLRCCLSVWVGTVDSLPWQWEDQGQVSQPAACPGVCTAPSSAGAVPGCALLGEEPGIPPCRARGQSPWDWEDRPTAVTRFAECCFLVLFLS